MAASMLRTVLLSAAAMPFLHGAAAEQGGEAVVLPGSSVTASPLGQTVDEMATPVASLSGEAFARRREATLGATLNGLPGVHFDHFGAGASRPVIRGQTAPRVKILSHGAEAHDASAISPDHAIRSEEHTSELQSLM